MKSLITIFMLIFSSCISQRMPEVESIEIKTNGNGKGNQLLLEFVKGPAHNHPSMALWVENPEGKYIETLFVTQYVATGSYEHGDLGEGKWSDKPGVARRPASLPYWAHKRGIKAADGLYIPSRENPLPDALTAATPKGNFKLNTSLTSPQNGKFRLMLEVNQPWDSNKFWTNNRFPDDKEYFTSLQPSLVYSAIIDPAETGDPVFLNPVGHGHPSGADGKLFTDLTTLTTAKEIIHSVSIRLK